MTKPDEHVLEIQYLRAVSTLGVVLTHISFGGWLFFGKYPRVTADFLGNWGVDFFFIISGFIVSYITRQAPHGTAPARDFLVHRMIRIIPGYWLYTGVQFLLLLLWSSYFMHGRIVSWRELVESLLFVKVHGFPVLGVGWTLNYEMFFYTLFAVIMVWCNHRMRLVAMIAILACLCLTRLFIMPVQPYLLFYTDSLMLEFCCGILLAWIYLAGKRCSPVLAWIMLSAGLAVLVAVCFLVDTNKSLTTRAFYYGLPATCITWGLLNLGQRWHLSWLVLLGNMSYSIYLCHLPVMSILAMLLLTLLPASLNPNTPFLVLALPSVLMVAWINYRVVEGAFGRKLKDYYRYMILDRHGKAG